MTSTSTSYRRFRPTVLACAIGSLLCGSAGLAHAQSAPSSAVSTTSAVETGRLADVTVTAQKIAQPSSKTALSLTAIRGEDLRDAGATSAVGLTDMIPNVQIGGGSASSTDISIRGIASTNTTEVGDPAAAFHIDGVYLGRPQSAGASFFDLERVEVLRGPQGTLYGRNATAGAINLITKKPVNRFAGEANLSVGNYGQRGFEGMLNVPVSDQFALRGVISTNNRDGFLITSDAKNRFGANRDDADNISARLHGLLKFNADTKLLVTVDASQDKGVGSGSVPLATYQTQTGKAQRTSLGNANEGLRDDKSAGFAAELTSQTGIGEFTYLGSYRTYDRASLSSTNLTASYTDSHFSQSSHELRLASTGKGPLTWVAGLYLFQETGDIYATYNSPLLQILSPYRFQQDPVESKSNAVFGQATYSLTPSLRLTGGLRYTADDKSRQGRLLKGNITALTDINNADVSYNKTTFKVGADYDVAKNILAYANVATGYKAGGYYDGDSSKGDNTYRPELLTSFEAGVKGRFLDNKLRLSAAVFTYDYKDLQVSYVDINPLTNAIGTITTNAARAKNTGLEIESKFALSENGTINFALGLLNAKYKDFGFAALPPVGTAPSTRPVGINYQGKRLDKAPDTTITLGYTHDWTLANGGAVTAYVGTRYSASYVLSNFAIAQPQQYTQKSFTRTDIRATYTAPGDKWYVQAYARNLENKSVMTGFTYSPLTGSNVYLAEPRTFGIRAGMKF